MSELRSNGARISLAGVEFDALTEREVVQQVAADLADGAGGWIATPNVDILRSTTRDSAVHDMVSKAPLVLPDGMPLLWAARLRGRPLPERVTGASLIWSLSATASAHGWSVYLLGGKPGIAERAGEMLRRRYPSLAIAGLDTPPPGFDRTPEGIDRVRRKLGAAAADIVYCGLGSPKQERLITHLAPAFPATWFVGCGAAITFAAGAITRAPIWMQASGLEWAYRLGREPRRLFKRYIVRDAPFAIRLLVAAGTQRLSEKRDSH